MPSAAALGWFAGARGWFSAGVQLFKQVFSCVSKAQPWQKYLEKKHQTASRRGSHQNLILRPDRFSELLSQQGFEKEISVSPHQMPDAILVFRKVARVQAESPPLMTEVFQAS